MSVLPSNHTGPNIIIFKIKAGIFETACAINEFLVIAS